MTGSSVAGMEAHAQFRMHNAECRIHNAGFTRTQNSCGDAKDGEMEHGKTSENRFAGIEKGSAGRIAGIGNGSTQRTPRKRRETRRNRVRD
jgi:hypothetical protein